MGCLGCSVFNSTVSRMVSAGHLRSARGHLMNLKVSIKAFQLGTLSSFHEAFQPGIVIDSVGFAAALELTYRTLHACTGAEIQVVCQQFDWFTLRIPKQNCDNAKPCVQTRGEGGHTVSQFGVTAVQTVKPTVRRRFEAVMRAG